jgi:hypothetical protein
MSLKAFLCDPALDLDGPTPPSLSRSVHLSLMGIYFAATITITYSLILRPEGSKQTLTPGTLAAEHQTRLATIT